MLVGALFLIKFAFFTVKKYNKTTLFLLHIMSKQGKLHNSITNAWYKNTHKINNIPWEQTWEQTSELSELLNLKKADQKQFYSKTSIISNIDEWDLVGVGGGSTFSDKISSFSQADYTHPSVQKCYQNFPENMKTVHDSKFQERFQELNLPLESQTFLALFLFNNAYHTHFGQYSKWDITDSLQRTQLYTEHKVVKLSQILEKNLAQCAEIAIMAQKILSENGISSKIVNWEVIWDFDREKENFWEAHSFLIIKDSSGEYIYDPANPHPSNQEIIFPAIFKVPEGITLEEFFQSPSKRFLKVQDLITKKDAYYGTSDQTAVFSNAIVE